MMQKVNARNRFPYPEFALQTSLAPMRAFTIPAFIRLMARMGPPDLFFTEFVRIHASSIPTVDFLENALKATHPTPCVVQLLGEDTPTLCKAMERIASFPFHGIDLNMGCPMPKIYKKQVGGGLLKQPEKIKKILDRICGATKLSLSVKTRIGFHDASEWPKIVSIFPPYPLRFITIHGRTVAQVYRGKVNYDAIQYAVQNLPFDVWANGEIHTHEDAARVAQFTGCKGVMIGRAALRNPWIFRQIREYTQGNPVFQPTLFHIRQYIEDLRQKVIPQNLPEGATLGRLKAFLNYIGPCVDPQGHFLKSMRISTSLGELLQLCDSTFLGTRQEEVFNSKPYDGLVARPNREHETGKSESLSPQQNKTQLFAKQVEA